MFLQETIRRNSRGPSGLRYNAGGAKEAKPSATFAKFLAPAPVKPMSKTHWQNLGGKLRYRALISAAT
jgi:hypothetical protein